MESAVANRLSASARIRCSYLSPEKSSAAPITLAPPIATPGKRVFWYIRLFEEEVLQKGLGDLSTVQFRWLLPINPALSILVEKAENPVRRPYISS